MLLVSPCTAIPLTNNSLCTKQKVIMIYHSNNYLGFFVHTKRHQRMRLSVQNPIPPSQPNKTCQPKHLFHIKSLHFDVNFIQTTIKMLPILPSDFTFGSCGNNVCLTYLSNYFNMNELRN